MQKQPVFDIIDRIKSVLPHGKEIFPLHEPLLGGNEWEYIKDCLDTGWVSYAGSFVDRFEKELADFTGASHAVVTGSGTVALYVCLLLAGVSAGDEVLVPALSFVATANAVAYCCAVPHFIDSDELSLGVDPAKLDTYLKEIAEVRAGSCRNRLTGRRISAVVPMHTFGHPVDMDPLLEICGRYNLVIIEDAAESLGSYYRGKHTGNFGLLSCLSFNGNKVATTGGGGAILTNDHELAAAARHLTTTAKVPHKWDYFHDRIGYNFRMPNINAAMGCAQLEQMPGFIEKKRKLADRYRGAFESCPVADFYVEREYAKSNYWLNAIVLKPGFSAIKEDVLEVLHEQKILARPVWKLLNSLPMFKDSPAMDVTVAESLEKGILNIPSSVGLCQ